MAICCLRDDRYRHPATNTARPIQSTHDPTTFNDRSFRDTPMTKPPKPPMGNRTPDTSTTRPVQDQGPPHSPALMIGPMPGPLLASLLDNVPTASSGRDTSPQVTVTYITDPVTTDLNAKLREISWPALQSHLLRPHESVDGLFFSPEDHLYAHLGEGGYYRAEHNVDGDLQIPWPAAPGVTPPLLKKSTVSHAGVSRPTGIPARQRLKPGYRQCWHPRPPHRRHSFCPRTWRRC